MEYRQIIYEPGKVARVKLNRPRYRNCLSRVLLEELDDAFRQAASDEEVRVIVLSGEGENFCRGTTWELPRSLPTARSEGTWPIRRIARADMK